MRFEDERYVRLYTRDTPEFLSMSWQARGLFALIMRKVDRAGILPLGRLGLSGVAISVGAPWVEIEPALRELLDDGCVAVTDDARTLLVPNFLAAQECKQTDAARKQASRELAKATFGTEQAQGDTRTLHRLAAKSEANGSRNVTRQKRHHVDSAIESPEATRDPGHTGSQRVTAGHSGSLCAEPIRSEPETPKPPSGAPCVLVSDEPERPAAELPPTLVPTRDHEPAEWRASQTTDDGVLGMLDGVYAMGLREGRPGQPVTGIRNRNDTAALRKVCLAHALGAEGNPLRSQALLDWTRAAAKEFSRTRPDTLTPTVNAFAGWLDRRRTHFDSGPKRHPAEANAPAQPRAFAKAPPSPAPTGNASGILDLIEAEHADCGAVAGPRSDVRGRDAPDIEPEEIGTSGGNVDGFSKRAGEAR